MTRARIPLALTLALVALVQILVLVRYAPPPPASLDAPRERFSATRARDVQRRLVGDGATRFVGTEGNARAYAMLVAEFERLGWSVERQSAISCTRHGMCAPVVNVVAHLVGREPQIPGVLLTAHYDSVLVSPGASDDGLGTAAVLEAARALSEGPKPRRTVIAVLTDGEEAGLLGADAFVRNHPLAGAVRATVNVDARGNRGPSQMFETSRGNAALVSLVAEHLERPVTTSVFYEVYKRMPNDTDFSITKTIAPGVNFANVVGIEHYHSPLDDLQASDPGTLQAHGDSVLAMTRAFAESDVARGDVRGDAVWFDVLAFVVVRWPESWSMLLALVALSLVVGHAIRARAFDRGLGAFVASLGPGAIAASAVGWALGASGALPAPWVAHPHAALLALHSAAGVGVLAGAFAMRRAPRASLWAGTWIGWGALGVLSAAYAPGMSYLFIVPTLAAGLAGSLPAVASVLPAVLASLLVLPLAVGIYDTLGFAVAPLPALPTILLLTTFVPMVGELPPFAKRIPLALAVLSLGFAIVALAMPKFTADIPQRANVVFRQDDTTARVFVDTTWGPSTWGLAPAAMLNALGTQRESRPALPWTLPSVSTEVKRLDLKPPTAEILAVEDDGKTHRVRVRLRSQRAAPTLAMVLPRGRPVEVKFGGRFALPRSIAAGTVVGLLAVPSDGVVVELESQVPGPIGLTLLDRSQGVPEGTKAEDAVRARPKEALPFQDGDVTVLESVVSL